MSTQSPNSLAAVDGWDELARRADHPFLGSSWLDPWLEVWRGGRTLELFLEHRGGDLTGGMALLRGRRGLDSPLNFHTPQFGALAASPEDRRALAAAVAGGDTPRAAIRHLDGADPLLAELLGEAAGPTVVRPRHVAPVVDTTGSLEDWRTGSKPKWGAPLERFRRKLIRDHGAEFHAVAEPEDVGTQLERGFAVEGSGWKRAAGTAILSDPLTTAFYRRMGRRFAEDGRLRLSWIEAEGEMIAWDLDLLHDNRLWLIKTGYDERFRRFAPGLVLRLAIVERCFELGLDSHELLGDTSGWKRKFAQGERPHFDLRLYAPGAAGRAGALYTGRLEPRLRRTGRRLLSPERRERIREARARASRSVRGLEGALKR